MPLTKNEGLPLKVIDEAAAAAEKRILQEKRLSYEVFMAIAVLSVRKSFTCHACECRHLLKENKRLLHAQE